MKKLLNKRKYIIVLLAIIFFLLFLFIFSTIAFFSASKKAEGDITLQELDYQILIDNNSKNLIVPGDNLDISVVLENKVENKNNLVPFYFRFKILNGLDDYNSSHVTLTTCDDFVFDNNFFYYKFKLNFQESVEIVKNIILDKNLTQQNVEELNLQILVEAVQSEFDAYKEIFFDAPSEWVEFIENN